MSTPNFTSARFAHFLLFCAFRAIGLRPPLSCPASPSLRLSAALCALCPVPCALRHVCAPSAPRALSARPAASHSVPRTAARQRPGFPAYRFPPRFRYLLSDASDRPYFAFSLLEYIGIPTMSKRDYTAL